MLYSLKGDILHDRTGQLMSVHLAKDRQHATLSKTAAHRIVMTFTTKAEGTKCMELQ